MKTRTKSSLTMMLLLAAVIAMSIPGAAFGEGKIGLTVNPYAAMNIGNMAAENYEPVFQFDSIGVLVTYDILLGDAGRLTPSIEDYVIAKFNPDGTVWTDTLELGATYYIGDFGIKAALPLILAGDPEPAQMVTNFYIQPSYKIKLEKPISITLDMKTLFYVFDVYAKNEDTLRLEPRVKFAYGDFYATARMNLFLPSFNNIEFIAYVGYTISDFTPELSVKLTNLNPLDTATEIGVVPYFKLSYKISL